MIKVRIRPILGQRVLLQGLKLCYKLAQNLTLYLFYVTSPSVQGFTFSTRPSIHHVGKNCLEFKGDFLVVFPAHCLHSILLCLYVQFWFYDTVCHTSRFLTTFLLRGFAQHSYEFLPTKRESKRDVMTKTAIRATYITKTLQKHLVKLHNCAQDSRKKSPFQDRVTV